MITAGRIPIATSLAPDCCRLQLITGVLLEVLFPWVRQLVLESLLLASNLAAAIFLSNQSTKVTGSATHHCLLTRLEANTTSRPRGSRPSARMSSPAPRVSRYPRASLQPLSSPTSISSTADFLSPDRNSEEKHKAAIADAKAYYDRVRATA